MEQPSRTIYKAGELAPEAEVILKDSCYSYCKWITDMGGKDVLHSKYDYSFEYTLGKEIVIDDFNLMYNVECASGFHFFRTREEAENY